jgi:hypothetical protein
LSDAQCGVRPTINRSSPKSTSVREIAGLNVMMRAGWPLCDFAAPDEAPRSHPAPTMHHNARQHTNQLINDRDMSVNLINLAALPRNPAGSPRPFTR